jgi:hypothetical protein
MQLMSYKILLNGRLLSTIGAISAHKARQLAIRQAMVYKSIHTGLITIVKG